MTASVMQFLVASAAAKETNLYEFKGGKDGDNPQGALLPDGSGGYYGTTTGYAWKLGNGGTVYHLTPPLHGTRWHSTTLHVFGERAGGMNPQSTLVADQNGNLYGTYLTGVFELSPPSGGGTAWTVSDISSGLGYTPGWLFQAQNGALIGVVSESQADVNGSVFMLTPPAQGQTQWQQTQIYVFQGNPDGEGPQGGLIADAAGNLYGVTRNGGPADIGTVYELVPPANGQTTWTEQVLYSFQRNATDGLYPLGGLLLDASGNLFGTTEQGGTNGDGTVFELSPPNGQHTSWSETVIHAFSGSEGSLPVAGVTAGANGILYGTLSAGPTVVFSLSPPSGGDSHWKFKSLSNIYKNHALGISKGGLIFGGDGALYGTAAYGGLTRCINGDGCGGVFRVTP